MKSLLKNYKKAVACSSFFTELITNYEKASKMTFTKAGLNRFYGAVVFRPLRDLEDSVTSINKTGHW